MVSCVRFFCSLDRSWKIFKGLYRVVWKDWSDGDWCVDGIGWSRYTLVTVFVVHSPQTIY